MPTGSDILKKYGVKPSAGASKTGSDILRKYGVKPGPIDIPSADEEMKRQFKPGMLQAGILGLGQGLSSRLGGKALGLLPGSSIKEAQQALDETQKQNPWTSGISEVAGTVMGPGKLVKGAKSAMGLAALNSLASSEGTKEGLIGDAGRTAGSVALSALPYAAGKIPWVQKAGNYASGLIGKASGAVGDFAENMAEKATGATRTISERFKPGSGRQLLDRKLVKFADSPMNIATRLTKAIGKSEEGIDDVLRQLDDAGVTINRKEIIQQLKDKAASLDEADFDVRGKLEKIIQNIEKRGAEKGDEISASTAEAIKRRYQGKANYTKPITTDATKMAASTYREAVENSAAKFDQGLADQFVENKELYGLLAPMLEGATKRAETLKQSPLGGLLDMSAMIGSLSSGNVPGALKTALLRRAIAPRLASSVAVTADKGAKLLGKSPEITQRLLPAAGTNVMGLLK